MEDILLHHRTHASIDKLIGRLPHALILEGPSGIGVRTVAEMLSRSMSSPLFVIEPKKIVNSLPVIDMNEGNIIIDDIRLLYEQTRSRQPGNHVYILDTGERSMTVAAQNAFLKLLEEPRLGLHFIIATHHYDQLLPTIASRSQRVTLLPISADMTKKLIDNLGLTDDTKKARLEFVSRGLPALTKKLASDEKLYEARVTIMSDAKVMNSGEIHEKAPIVQRYRDNRADALTLIDDMNHQLKVIVKSRPDKQLVARIAKNFEARQRILAGGNIRLQLMAIVI